MKMRELLLDHDNLEGSSRLDELQGVRGHLAKAGEFQNKNDVVAYLKQRGFAYVGHGTYAGVFDHPSFRGRYVLKVFCDKHYEVFLNYCIQHQGNDHLPKIYGKVLPLGQNGRMVRIEKLRPLTAAEYRSLELGKLNDYVWDHLRKPSPEAERSLVAWADRNDLRDLLSTVIDVMRSKPEGALPDLNSGNFMWRGRTLVLTDPYAGAEIPFTSIKVV
jgi:hypothetical protein